MKISAQYLVDEAAVAFDSGDLTKKAPAGPSFDPTLTAASIKALDATSRRERRIRHSADSWVLCIINRA